MLERAKRNRMMRSYMTSSTPNLSEGSCTTGCFAFRTTAALRKLTQMKWSVAQDGVSYMASGDRLTLEAWAETLRPFLDPSVPDHAHAIWVQGSPKHAFLHINRKACETGKFVEKASAAITSPTLAKAGFESALCAEALERLMPGYQFAIKPQASGKPAIESTMNADTARAIQAALFTHAAIPADITLKPCRPETPQRDKRATLTIHGDSLTYYKLKALESPALKLELESTTLDHLAKATSASRGR